jgi:hypothetical protein
MAQTPGGPADAANPATTPTKPTYAPFTGADAQHFIFWGVGAAALITMADFAPKPAIILTSLVGLGVVLRFSTQLQTWLSGLTGTATGSAQAPASGSQGTGSNSSGTGGGNITAFPSSPFIRGLIRQGGIAG